MESRNDEIKRLRAAGLTVREVAVRVGVSRSRVGQLTVGDALPALVVTLDDQGRAIVTGDLDPKLLATHVVRALQRSADVRYEA